MTAARLIGLDDPCRLPRQACASGARTHTLTHTHTDTTLDLIVQVPHPWPMWTFD